MRPLTWTDDKTTTPDLLLARLRQRASHLLRLERGPDFDPWWRKRAGYMQDAALDRTEQNIRDFNAKVGSDALMEGMRILGMPWGADWMCICAGVAKWAESALCHMIDLERDLEASEARRAEAERAGAASLAAERLAHQATSQSLGEAIAHERAGLAREEALGEKVADLERRLAQAQADLSNAQRDGAEARRVLASVEGERNAWRTTAESLRASMAMLWTVMRPVVYQHDPAAVRSIEETHRDLLPARR